MKKNISFNMKSIEQTEKHSLLFIKNIGTNEKAHALLRKAYEPTKKHGFTMKNIGTNEKARILM